MLACTFAKTEDDLVAQVREAAVRAEVRLSAAFLETLARAQMRVDGEELLRLVEAGRVAEAAELLRRALEEDEWGVLWDATLAAVLAAAAIAASLTQRRLVAPAARLAVGTTVASPDAGGGPEGRLVMTSPEVAAALEQARREMVSELTLGASRALSLAVVEAQGLAQRGVAAAAAMIRGAAGLSEVQQRALLVYRRQLLDGDLRVLRRYVREGAISEEVLRRVVAGRRLSEAEVDRLVEARRLRMLRARAVLVARSRASWAVQTGQLLFWRQMVARGRLSPDDVRKTWLYTADDRVRHAHRTIPSLNPEGRGLGEPFQSSLGPIMWPHDPSAVAANTINCRCTIVYRLVPRGL